MALKPCKECGHQVSTGADACPSCGAKVPKAGCLGTVGVLFAALVTFVLVGQMFGRPADEPRPSTAAVSAVTTSECPGTILEGGGYVTSPDWVSRNRHCINDLKAFEQQLYAAVRKVPAADHKRNRDGYLGLSYLDSTNDQYKSKYQHYKQLAETSGGRSHPKIHDYAISDLLTYRQQFPKTAAMFGDRLSEVVDTLWLGAVQVAESGKCDVVEYGDIADSRATRENAQFFYDCLNGKRVYLSESDIRNKGEVKTQEELAVSNATAREMCETMVKREAMHPSAVKFHPIVGTAVYRAPTTGNVVVTMDFEAKNSFGMEVEFTARCTIPPQGQPEVIIAERHQ